MGSGRGSACKCRREAIGGVEEGTERSESDQNTRDRLIEEEEVVRKARTKENEGYLEHQSETAHDDAEAPIVHPVHLQLPVLDRINGRSPFWLCVVV